MKTKLLFLTLLFNVLILSSCGKGDIFKSDPYEVELVDNFNGEIKAEVIELSEDLTEINISKIQDKGFVRFGYYIKELVEVNDDYSNGVDIIPNSIVKKDNDKFVFDLEETNKRYYKIVWEPNVYRINYMMENGNLRDNTKETYFYINYDEILPDALNYDDLRLPGYYFIGWYTQRTGKGFKYADLENWIVPRQFNKENFSDLFVNIVENNQGEYEINLYAFWDKD